MCPQIDRPPVEVVVAASYADRVVFLADGQIIDQLFDPTADAVLEPAARFRREQLLRIKRREAH